MTLDSCPWRILDAEHLHRQNLNRFYIPPLSERESLRRDDHTKMIFSFEFDDGGKTFEERMWVKVTDVIGENYKGILDSKPTSIEENEHFWLGSEITFHPKNIIQIFRKDDPSP